MIWLIGSIDWSNFVNARSHHGNVDLQTVGKSWFPLINTSAQLTIADLTLPLPFESGYFGVYPYKRRRMS